MDAEDLKRFGRVCWQSVVGYPLSPIVLDKISHLPQAVCLVSENGKGEISGYLVALVRAKNNIPVGEVFSCNVNATETPLGVTAKLWSELERVCTERQILLVPKDRLAGCKVG